MIGDKWEISEEQEKEFAATIQRNKDAELGAMVRKMPTWFALQCLCKDPERWAVFNHVSKSIAAQADTPEEALKIALEAAGSGE